MPTTIKYQERPCVAGCGKIIDHLYPTCGAKECRKKHRKMKNADYTKARYDRLVAEGRCGKCGRKIPSNAKNRKTGTRIRSRCAICRRKVNAAARTRYHAQAARKRKIKAAARIAEKAIQRARNNTIRAEVGLPPSRSAKVRKDIIRVEEL